MLAILLFCIAVVCLAILLLLLYASEWTGNIKHNNLFGELIPTAEIKRPASASYRHASTLITSGRESRGSYVPQLELRQLVDLLWNSPIEDLPLNTYCVEAFGITLLRQDLLKLKTGDWINDEVINFYMALIAERSKILRTYPKVYAFSSFFYTTYTDKGFVSVKKWTKNVDLFNYNILLVPVHRGAHWCLVVIDLELEKIEFYDSTLSDGSPILLNLRQYLMEEHRDKNVKELDTSHWFLESKKGIPTQKNGYDCGIFLCRFAECASRRVPINFTQENMVHFRAQMTYEIFYTRLFA